MVKFLFNSYDLISSYHIDQIVSKDGGRSLLNLEKHLNNGFHNVIKLVVDMQHAKDVRLYKALLLKHKAIIS